MARQDISQSPLVKAARKKRQKAPGVGSIGIGFAQGINQGIQMGMYRAMQQQKAGLTENEELAKKLNAIPTTNWSSEKKAKLNTTIFALKTDPNLGPDDRQVFIDEWMPIIADPTTYEKAIDPIGEKIKSLLSEVKDPRSKEDLINLQYRYQRKELTPDEVNEVLQESGMVSPERFEAKPDELRKILSEDEAKELDLPLVANKVWQYNPETGDAVLKGVAPPTRSGITVWDVQVNNTPHEINLYQDAQGKYRFGGTYTELGPKAVIDEFVPPDILGAMQRSQKDAGGNWFGIGGGPANPNDPLGIKRSVTR